MSHPYIDLVAHGAEGLPTLRFGGGGRVGDTPVQMLWFAGKGKVVLAHPIADGDHVIERLPGERVEHLGRLFARVDIPVR